MIDTGESETIFQKAILEQGRGHVSFSMALLSGTLCVTFVPMHTSAVSSVLLGIS